jgi:hypothetical protein
VFGARLSGAIDLDSDGHAITLGTSFMTGRYDPDRHLAFVIGGADLVANLDGIVIRTEYLARRTEMAVTVPGVDPATRWKYGPGSDGRYDDHFFKHGFYAEAEVPIGRVDVLARFDGLLRFGNVLAGSALSSRSTLLRYTAGAAIRITENVRLKTSVEYYQFNDLPDDLALHIGVATPF